MNNSELLLEYLTYFPDTGDIYWKKSPGGNVVAGRIAGCVSEINKSGKKYCFRTVRFKGKLYLSSRIAWRMEHGEWPTAEIDHRNCDSLDNRISNLRPAVRQENTWNTRARSDSASGLKGVGYNRHAKAWKAKIRLDGKQRHLGYFPTPEEAHAAYRVAAENRRGEFARHG